MAVHVEQARQQHATAGIDDVVGLGRLVAAGSGDGNDAAVTHHHVGGRAECGVLAVEHARVADQGGALERMAPGAFAGRPALRLRPASAGSPAPRRWRSSPPRSAAGSRGRWRRTAADSASVVAQTNCRCQADAGHREQLHLALHRPSAIATRDFDFGHLAHGQRAARNQRQLAVGALGQCSKATELPAGVPLSGEYSAVPLTVCSPWSEVDFHVRLVACRG